MKPCKTIGCNNQSPKGDDYCVLCENKMQSLLNPNAPSANEDAPISFQRPDTSSGGDNDYWVAFIAQPKRLEAYSAECEDLIEHFQMTFQEGEAFKALWRKGQMRVGNGKPGDTHLRNAQKVRHFGTRMEVMETRALECQK